jgi:hypothetical protein
MTSQRSVWGQCLPSSEAIRTRLVPAPCHSQAQYSPTGPPRPRGLVSSKQLARLSVARNQYRRRMVCRRGDARGGTSPRPLDRLPAATASDLAGHPQHVRCRRGGRATVPRLTTEADSSIDLARPVVGRPETPDGRPEPFPPPVTETPFGVLSPAARPPDVLAPMICAHVLARSAYSQGARDRHP